jgi:hypothetical protein
MKRVVFIAVAALAACAAPSKLPEPTSHVDRSADFEEIRPVSIVVLPVQADKYEVKHTVRQEMYDGLFEKNYSPISLQKIDSNLNSAGEFSASDVDWDAKLIVRVSKWEVVGNGTRISADGSVRLLHRETDEILWQLAFQDQLLDADASGKRDEKAAGSLVKYILHSEGFPERPALR